MGETSPAGTCSWPHSPNLVGHSHSMEFLNLRSASKSRINLDDFNDNHHCINYVRRNASLSTLLTGDPPNHVVEEWMKFDFDVNAVSPKTTNSTRVFPPIPFKQKVPGKPSGLKFLVKFDEAEFACRQKDGTGFTVIWQKS